LTDFPEHTPYALSHDEGKWIKFLGTLMTVKAGADATQNTFTLIEQILPPGFASPPHVHHREDEAFYILQGMLTVTCGEQRWQLGPGSFVFLPCGIAHYFSIEGLEPARMLQITTPAGFERFAEELGEPAEAHTQSSSGQPDIQRLLEVAAKYHIEIKTSPPAD
jgi:mannose-6-phosphate isomerase-like protein (cupin superfamily)